MKSLATIPARSSTYLLALSSQLEGLETSHDGWMLGLVAMPAVMDTGHRFSSTLCDNFMR